MFIHVTTLTMWFVENWKDVLLYTILAILGGLLLLALSFFIYAMDHMP